MGETEVRILQILSSNSSSGVAITLLPISAGNGQPSGKTAGLLVSFVFERIAGPLKNLLINLLVLAIPWHICRRFGNIEIFKNVACYHANWQTCINILEELKFQT